MPEFDLSEQHLRDVIAQRPVGPAPPYAGGVGAEIEDHLRRVVAALASDGLLDVEADFDHYWSGYASYVDVFCSKSGGRSTTREGTLERTDGLSLYLCRLAPVAAVGPGQTTRQGRSTAGSGFLRPESVGATPDGDWAAESRAVSEALSRYGFSVPARAELSAPLPFDAQIATVLSDPPYQVYDALFYWED